MAVATDREYGLFIGGESTESVTGEGELALETLDLYLETKCVVVSTGARPTNPFGL